jgi:translocation and assembly module TamA
MTTRAARPSTRSSRPLAWLLATLALVCAPTRAADPPEAPPAATAAGSESSIQGAPPATEAAFRYRIAITAPGALKDVLVASVGLVRWQDYADMTEDLFDRLAKQALDEAREAAATEGFFSAQVDIDVDRTSSPAGVTLRVTTGEPTRIRDVDVRVQGPASATPRGAATIATMREQWRLPIGAIFRQAAWDEAKQRAVATLAANEYAAARLTDSRAEIDPDARTADLAVSVDSGPPFRIGAVEVTGTKRYDAELVRNYGTLRRGDPYLLSSLDQYVRRLTATGYFASVHASIDTDPAHADDAAVTVSVLEAPPKRLETGIGFSTDTRVRANLNYRDVDVAQRALRFTADLRLEQKLQNVSLQLARPPDPTGWSQAGTLQVERTDLAGLVTETASVGARRISLDERDQWQYGAAYLVDRLRPSGGDTTEAHALYTDVERAWRRVDDLASPTRGTIALLQVGVGVPGVSSRTFGRVVGRFAAWRPIDRDDDLTARVEAGAVLASSRDGVPSSLLFRTGGDQSVRGYAFESLGVRVGDATLPGRYYVAGSVEATHWIREAIGVAAFVDAGDAFDDRRDLRIAVGYGVGARVRTPIGPFRLDVAYGQRTRAVRLHFSVGLAF